MRRLICAGVAFALTFATGAVSAADVAPHQWVRAAADGNIHGRVVVPRNASISAAGGVEVALIDQSGQAAAAPTKSDNGGRFILTGVKPGVYSMVIRGEEVFAFGAVHVVERSVPISEQLEIAAGSVHYSVVKSAVLRYMPAGKPAKVVFDPSKSPISGPQATFNEVIRVSQFEGGLRGKLARPGSSDNQGAKNSNVIILRDGAEVARTITDEQGEFVVADLEPGSYSVIGLGVDGFGVMGLELIDPLTVQTASRSSAGSTLVAQTEAEASTFVMQVAPLPPGANVVSDELVSEEVIGEDDGTGAPIEGGGSYGGGGGGGGMGGGGGFGGLAAIGGLAAAIAIAGGDNNNGVVLPPPASPSSP